MADRISSLPDAILCHILSFLPTKLAVATSVLSKRWNPLWRSVPILDFDDTYAYEKKDYVRFNHFVDSVISCRDPNQSIKRFRFASHCPFDNNDDDNDNVKKWVNIVVQRGIEHLELKVDPSIDLPSAVFSCRTLVVLKLHEISVETLSSVYLPSLKILQLNLVEFSKPRYLMEILSACPVLEDLKIGRLYIMDSLVGEDISEKCLPKLVRADICNLHTPLKAAYNVNFLRLEDVQLRYNGIPEFHNLTQLELIFVNFSWHWTLEMLKHCPKLQILVINKRILIEVYEENWSYPQHVPKCLLLHLRSCTVPQYLGQEGEFVFARYILENARVLQTMTIHSVLRGSDENIEILKKLSSCPRSSPACQLLFEW